MDDGRFDKGIKAKLEGFQPESFDPAALASLHHQMASQALVPWYAAYRTELFTAGSIALAATVIIWFQWWFTKQNTSQLEAALDALHNQSQQVDNLQQKLQELRSAPPDTVHIIEVRNESSTVYLRLIRKIAQLEAELAELEKTYALNTPEEELSHSPSTSFTEGELQFNNPTLRISPRPKETISQRAQPGGLPMDVAKIQRGLSTRTIRDIQRHYHKGIGIRVGPSLSFTRGSYNLGDGRYDVGIGLLTDLVVSPSLSLETGLNYTLRHYQIPRADMAEPDNFPGVKAALGEVQNVDIESWVWEVPVNLKYRYPVSLKSNWLASAGYSIPIYSLQVLEHDYRFDTPQAATLSTSQRYNAFKLYTGTLNLAIGYGHELKNKKVLETSLIYQQGLGKSGIEGTKPTFVGLRGVYYIKLK